MHLFVAIFHPSGGVNDAFGPDNALFHMMLGDSKNEIKSVVPCGRHSCGRFTEKHKNNSNNYYGEQ